MLELMVAAVAAAATIAYGILGGADFGGGVWDLFARGPREKEQRALIARAMGPVWEANHVWLIFLVIVLFTAFPRAYAALSVALFLPFHIVLLGIVLRGAAFVFRSYSPHAASGADSTQARRWGVVFGAASTMTPLLLGACLGAVSAGGIRIDSLGAVTTQRAWTSPVSLTMGVLALSLCAYLAAVFLTNETEDERLREDFRKRALLAGTVTVALSALLLPLVRFEARHLWDGLFSVRATPVLAAGIAAALSAGWLIRTRRWRAARIAAILQIACLLGGWALAQYPYLIYPDLEVRSGAAPPATLQFLLIALVPGMALLLPSLWLLFRVFNLDRDAAH